MLSRGLVLSVLGLAFGLAVGAPVVLVLVSPLALVTTLGLLRRPRSEPVPRLSTGTTRLLEGQATTSRLVVSEAEDVEYLVRVSAGAPYLHLDPPRGVTGGLVDGASATADLTVVASRWGRHRLGEERIGGVSPWGGYQWGPVPLVGHALLVLPTPAPFDSRAPVPHPRGLVGQHRALRPGSGSELAGIRPFAAGDRLRRINWRVSLRSRDLHVVDTYSEQDSGVLLVVDAYADLGVSTGIAGVPSSLDVSVRAAAALAEHHLRQGDRVGLRVLGRTPSWVGLGSGQGHLRRLQGTLAEVTAGDTLDEDVPSLRLGVTEGTFVILLSPVLHPVVGSLALTLAESGVDLVVVDALPAGVRPEVREGMRPEVADLAWRMRRLDRALTLERLTASACPVVPWRGPGSLDEVLQRMARRARLPRMRAQ